MPQHKCLFGGEEEVGGVGGPLPAVVDEHDGPPHRVGDTADQVGTPAGAALGNGRRGHHGRARRPEAHRRLACEQRRHGDGVGGRRSVGGVGEVREAEAVPAGRGPVVDRRQEGNAAGRERDAEGAVGGGGQVVLPYPAAQQVLDRRRLGRGVDGGMLQQVGGCATQPLGLPGPSLLPGDRVGPRDERGLCGAGRSLVGVGTAVGCGGRVQESSSWGRSGSCGDEPGRYWRARGLGRSWSIRVRAVVLVEVAVVRVRSASHRRGAGGWSGVVDRSGRGLVRGC